MKAPQQADACALVDAFPNLLEIDRPDRRRIEVSISTVERVRRLDGTAEVRLIAVACGEPHAGCAR